AASLIAGARRSDAEFAREFLGDREVGASIVRLIQNVKVTPAQPDAAEAIRAARQRRATHQIRTRRTVFTIDAMLAADQTLRAAAMRTVRTHGAAHAEVAADQTFGIFAKRAAAAGRAALALDA